MSDIDVQLHPKGVAIIPPDEVWDENLPGQLNLTNDEADQLRDMLNEAWLNRSGLESRSVQVDSLEVGDILPALGLTVMQADNLDDYGKPETEIIFVGHQPVQWRKLILPSNLEITVHRRIQ